MNSSVRVFLSLLVLVFISVGGYWGVVKVLDVYKKMEKSLSEKKISVKPENIKGKQALVDSWSIDKNEFTFFDILDDPSMTKFIGLNKNSINSQEVVNEAFNLEIKKQSISQSDNLITIKAMNSDSHKSEAQKRDKPFASAFVLQVGSFKALERANLLKNNLNKKGYPAFVEAAQLSEGGEIWHRVFVGGFEEKGFAFKTKTKIKEKENLNSVMKWHDAPMHRVSQ